ncbi:uncharacterized protein LOC101454358 isoform X2 [Ceratitis capitata]|uniref:uncharacterized protein LOC101454358 isoform X2 n=1 Tax=Ceratitis capitata TaxID=7213 RepID=UPI000C6C69C1|nr:uncharacterized protein LOC101454358 isoform X2 [Ceratitis capitata]
MLNSKQVIFKTFGKNKPIRISYGLVGSRFGDIVLGFLTDSKNAICYLHFAESHDKENKNYEVLLQRRWPEALLNEDVALAKILADKIFSDEAQVLNVITCTYSDIAKRIGKPNAVRAVGTAVGSNEVSIVIPCHRVVSRNGDVKYGGGKIRKINMLTYERENSNKIYK